MTQIWKYTDASETVVSTSMDDRNVSCLVTAQEYLDSVAGGAITLPPDPPSASDAIEQSANALLQSRAKSLASQGRTNEALLSLMELLEKLL